MINDKLRNRVENWKFTQALKYIDNDVTKEEKEAIETLERLLGDS